MERYSYQSNSLLKCVAACTLLAGALFFAEPVKAESRELTATVPTVAAPAQVAWVGYYGGYRPWGFYHPYRYWGGSRYYWGSRYYYRPYWNYYRW